MLFLTLSRQGKVKLCTTPEDVIKTETNQSQQAKMKKKNFKECDTTGYSTRE